MTARLDYLAFLELAEGRVTPDDFVARHLEFIEGAEFGDDFLRPLRAAFGLPNAT